MKNILLITFLFLFVSVYPCNHDNFIDKNEVRYFKVKDVDEYNQMLLRSSKNWETFSIAASIAGMGSGISPKSGSNGFA